MNTKEEKRMKVYTWIYVFLFYLLSFFYFAGTAGATGEACVQNSDYQIYDSNFFGYIPTNAQTAGTLIQGGGLWALYKSPDFTFDNNYSPIRVDATNRIMGYPANAPNPAFSDIFANFGAGEYFAYGNSGYLGLCGDITNGGGYSHFFIDVYGGVTFYEVGNNATGTAYGIFHGNTFTRFLAIDIYGTSTVNLLSQFYLDPNEINPKISAYNPTSVRYWYSYATSTEFDKINIPIESGTLGTSTATATLSSLADGNYDVLIGFTNFGCISGLSDCPFPNEYIYTSFLISGGVLVSTGTVEIYTEHMTDEELANIRMPCSITNISGCIANLANDIATWTQSLFVPKEVEINALLETARTSILTKAPWGYATRMYDIFTDSATGTLPSFEVPIPTGAGSEVAEYEYVTFDVGDMVTGGGTLLDSVRDPVYNKSVRDIFEPWVRGTIALLVVLTILADVMRSHAHEERLSQRQGTLS